MSDDKTELSPKQLCDRLNAYDEGRGYRGQINWKQLIASPQYIASTGSERGESYPRSYLRIDLEDACALVAGWDAQAELAKANEQAVFWQKQADCPVCYGTPHASGLTCICGGNNLAWHAVEGFQKALFDAEQQVAKLTDAVELHEQTLRGILAWKTQHFVGDGACLLALKDIFLRAQNTLDAGTPLSRAKNGEAE